jgi:hypothetical protein
MYTKNMKKFNEWLNSQNTIAGQIEDDEIIWSAEHKRLKAMDEQERDRFEGMETSEAIYEYSQVLLEIKTEINKTKMRIAEFLKDYEYTDCPKDFAIDYYNLTRHFAFIGRLQNRMLVIRNRIKVLTKYMKLKSK